MKLKELSNILFSTRGNILMCIIYDISKGIDIETECSVEYAIEHYGEREVHRLTVDHGSLVIGLL